MHLKPLSTFDCLYLGSRLQRWLGGFSAAELHLLAYLACLLSLYHKIPVADWGYGFVGTEHGAPFSLEIKVAAQELENRGFFYSTQDKLQMTVAAEELLKELEGMSLYEERTDCLNAASSSIVAFSVGTVREALNNEPELQRAKQMPTNRVLLEEPGIDIIYEHFGLLREALGDRIKDLRLPAVAWLTALFRYGKEEAQEYD